MSKLPSLSDFLPNPSSYLPVWTKFSHPCLFRRQQVQEEQVQEEQNPNPYFGPHIGRHSTSNSNCFFHPSCQDQCHEKCHECFVPGPPGPPGLQGATGASGATGSQGLIGPTGPSLGPTGPTGDIGATGATGPRGIQGIQGLVGPQGIQGPTGQQGPISVPPCSGVLLPYFSTILNANIKSIQLHQDFYGQIVGLDMILSCDTHVPIYFESLLQIIDAAGVPLLQTLYGSISCHNNKCFDTIHFHFPSPISYSMVYRYDFQFNVGFSQHTRGSENFSLCNGSAVLLFQPDCCEVIPEKQHWTRIHELRDYIQGFVVSPCLKYMKRETSNE